MVNDKEDKGEAGTAYNTKQQAVESSSVVKELRAMETSDIYPEQTIESSCVTPWRYKCGKLISERHLLVCVFCGAP